MINTEGKIIEIYFGVGGPHRAQIGLNIKFDTNEGIYSAFMGWWNTDYQVSEAQRNYQYSEIVRQIDHLLKVANVDKIDKLVNMPVLCTIEDGGLTEWRILTEIFAI